VCEVTFYFFFLGTGELAGKDEQFPNITPEIIGCGTGGLSNL